MSESNPLSRIEFIRWKALELAIEQQNNLRSTTSVPLLQDLTEKFEKYLRTGTWN